MRGLLETERNVSSTSKYEAPENDFQRNLIHIWKEVLGDVEIGINDNFFDLGGNSIKIVRMVRAVNDRYERRMTVLNAFEFPTIAAISDFLKESNLTTAENGESNLEELTDVRDQTLSLLNTHDNEGRV
jgi:acyl carrier protein